MVSIHAPTRGATYRYVCTLANDCFNPRTHTGCDYNSCRIMTDFVSFNPRTHTGCDKCKNRRGKDTNCFNPRTHTGCDTNLPRCRKDKQCFNPRTHTGCDNAITDLADGLTVSIHAPTRGATSFITMCIFRVMFQSTHPHGVRLIARHTPCSSLPFQSTHPHGVRP